MKLFYKALILFMICLLVSCSKQGKDLDDLIEIQYSGEYVINEEIWIEEDEKLIIEPGTTITFGPQGSFQIKGELQALGTAENHISLIGSKDLASHTIFNIYDENAINCILHYTDIENGLIITEAENNEFFEVHISNNKSLTYEDASIRSWRGSFTFVNGSITSNNTGEGLLIHNSESPIVENSFFDQIPDAIEFIDCHNGTISNSIFQNMSDDGIDNNNCDNTQILNNEFYNVGHRAIEIGSDSFGPSYDIQVDNNLFVNCHIGINIKEASTAIVHNATFYKTKMNIELLNEMSSDQLSKLSIYNSVMSGDHAWIKTELKTELIYESIMSDQSVEDLDQIHITGLQFQDIESSDFTIVSNDFPTGHHAQSIGYQKQ